MTDPPFRDPSYGAARPRLASIAPAAPTCPKLVTMTMWSPSLEAGDRPLFLAIARALQRDVEEGRLQPGQRLPTHRELARSLGVTIGTVTHAYAEARRR